MHTAISCLLLLIRVRSIYSLGGAALISLAALRLFIFLVFLIFLALLGLRL
jgi:hypothetical protein